MSRVAEGLGWRGTANRAVLAEGHRLLIDDPTRFDGVHVIGLVEVVAMDGFTGIKAAAVEEVPKARTCWIRSTS